MGCKFRRFMNGGSGSYTRSRFIPRHCVLSYSIYIVGVHGYRLAWCVFFSWMR